MSRKWQVVMGLAVVALVAVAVAVPAFAQEPTPTPAPKSYGWRGGGRGFGVGRGICGQAEMEAVAKALGMTTDELSTQLWGGRTLADLADKADVDLQTIRDAVDAARQEATQEAIEQAVEEGRLTQEQADWLLKGLELGFLPGGRGIGFGPGFGFGHEMRGRFGNSAPPSAPSTAPSSSSL